ncbi:MAG: TrmH family RNA methyltransferase, partial [Flavobacteriaceae bacterium]
MVVKNQIKFIKSLQQKKYRNQHRLFVAEGVKLVGELLNSQLSPAYLYSTDDNFRAEEDIDPQIISESDLKRMSGLKTPNKVLGVFEMPTSGPLVYSKWILALDRVQDPGNLGTIIRLADWFGIDQLLCS